MIELPDNQKENMVRLLAFVSFLNDRYDARITDDRVCYCSLLWSDFFHKDVYRIRLSEIVPAHDKTMSGGSGAYDGTFSMSDQVVVLPSGTDVNKWVDGVRGLHKWWWDSIRALSYRHTWQREPASVAYAAFEYIGQEVTIEKLN